MNGKAQSPPIHPPRNDAKTEFDAETRRRRGAEGSARGRGRRQHQRQRLEVLANTHGSRRDVALIASRLTLP